MVSIDFSPKFQKIISKIKDDFLRTKIKKQLRKIIQNPKVGKPMKNARRGTRELYLKPFRLSYAYIEKEKKIIILNLYHKDFQ